MPDPDLRFSCHEAGDLLRLSFDPARDPAFTAALERLLGAPLPEPDRPAGDEAVLIWQGPHDMLILGLGSRRAALEEMLAGRPALLGDAGAGLVLFDMAGEGSGFRLDHDRPGSGRRSRVMRLAGLRVTALWLPEGEPRVRLFVDRSHADYMRHWLADRWRAVREEVP